MSLSDDAKESGHCSVQSGTFLMRVVGCVDASSDGSNSKELESIVDYARSPGTTGTAAIDPMFNATTIVNEAGQDDYPCYWSGTTHENWTSVSGANGVYVAFGRAMGYMGGTWADVHGAGAQRSDPKTGDPDDFPTGFGPQGDAIRIENYVRLVRHADG